MSYCTHDVSRAVGFNGHGHASMFACLGYNPEDLPPSRAKYGETVGLRDANGDWIKDIIAWWEHDRRAERSFVSAMAEAAKRKDNEPFPNVYSQE